MANKLWITAAATLAVAVCCAQPPESPSRPDPKETAQHRTTIMKERLGLSEKQTGKVYKINLQHARKAVSATPAARPSEGHRPGGGPGGGMRGGAGGAVGGMRGGAGGPGGRMTESGIPGGAPGGRDRIQNPQQERGPQALPHFAESEKDVVKCDRKMQKILDRQQYEQWRMMEAERLREEFRPRIPVPENHE